MNKPLEVAQVYLNLGGTGSEGITRVGQKISASLIETQVWFAPKYACWQVEVLNKGKIPSANTSVWKNSISPALALKLNNSVSSTMFLSPFELPLRVHQLVSSFIGF